VIGTQAKRRFLTPSGRRPGRLKSLSSKPSGQSDSRINPYLIGKSAGAAISAAISHVSHTWLGLSRCSMAFRYVGAYHRSLLDRSVFRRTNFKIRIFPWDHQCVHYAGAVTYQKWIINSVIFNIDGSGENSACIQKLFACPTPLGKGIGGRRED
jgi:hypothetical protein